MTNFAKLNSTQKDIMADFMAEHPNLAQNNFSNSVQGRASSNRLWQELSRRLNAVGPPVKDPKLWRKVYADQKYQAKKKLSLNKASKHRIGGASYSGKVITATEEMIIEAAGLEASVESNKSFPVFVNASTTESFKLSSDSSGNGDSDGEANSCHSALPDPSTSAFNCTRSETPFSNTQIPRSRSDEKLALLQQNLKSVANFQKNLDSKIDRLLETQEKLLAVNERLLAIKEEKHRSEQTSREVDLEIKRLKLETLAMVINRL